MSDRGDLQPDTNFMASPRIVPEENKRKRMISSGVSNQDDLEGDAQDVIRPPPDMDPWVRQMLEAIPVIAQNTATLTDDLGDVSNRVAILEDNIDKNGSDISALQMQMRELIVSNGYLPVA